MRREDFRSWMSRHDVLTRIAIGIWAVIGTIILIKLLRNPGDKNSIFKLLYDTGTAWRNGLPLYADEGTYRYSPGVAGILSLFSRLPLRLASIIWLAISLTAFWSGFIYWLRTALPDPRDRDYRALLILIATPLLVGNFNNLQANPICLGAMLATVAAALRKKWMIAAVCIAAATMLKIYPLAAGLVMLILFPRRMWLAMVVGLFIAAVTPFLFQRPEYVLRCYHEWADSLVKDQRFDRPLETSYRDAALLWRAYVGPLDARVYQLITLIGAAAVGAAAFLMRFSRRPDAVKAHFLLALVVCWIMLLGPSTESATYMMLAPLAAWLMAESFYARWPLALRIVCVWVYLILIAEVVIVAVVSFHREFTAMGPQPVAAMLALGASLAIPAFSRPAVSGVRGFPVVTAKLF